MPSAGGCQPWVKPHQQQQQQQRRQHTPAPAGPFDKAGLATAALSAVFWGEKGEGVGGGGGTVLLVRGGGPLSTAGPGGGLLSTAQHCSALLSTAQTAADGR
jgi:hypothetical protein